MSGGRRKKGRKVSCTQPNTQQVLNRCYRSSLEVGDQGAGSAGFFRGLGECVVCLYYLPSSGLLAGFGVLWLVSL